MKFLKLIRNYLCYCGIEKDDYNAVKKDAYVSNFKTWRILHCLMTAVFAFLFVNSLINSLLAQNKTFYLIALIYSAIITAVFFIFNADSLAAQLLIYLSISMLFLFSIFVTSNKPEYPATMFIVLLIITPMFMIDKPYFMGIELSAASVVFLFWMYGVKPYDVWQIDLINVVIFLVVGFFIHIIANSIRIKEFVLRRTINIQKDTDDLTGLKNKGALTRAINEYLADRTKDKGILFLLDIDRFKSINDTYGHDVGDSVIRQMGELLSEYFKNGEIAGRFGGDEFIFFVKDTDDADLARKIADDVASGAHEKIELPDKEQKIDVSIGIALYHGIEKNYSEIFKKADVALYEVKSERTEKHKIYK